MLLPINFGKSFLFLIIFLALIADVKEQIEKNLDEIGEEFKSWVDGEANTKLDKWFKKYGKEFI